MLAQPPAKTSQPKPKDINFPKTILAQKILIKWLNFEKLNLK